MHSGEDRRRACRPIPREGREIAMDSTRTKRRAESRLRLYRQGRRGAAAVLFAIVVVALLASKGGGGSSKEGAHGAKPRAAAIVDGGPISPASVGGLGALWGPANG